MLQIFSFQFDDKNELNTNLQHELCYKVSPSKFDEQKESEQIFHLSLDPHLSNVLCRSKLFQLLVFSYQMNFVLPSVGTPETF